jgi:hypothetical protein
MSRPISVAGVVAIIALSGVGLAYAKGGHSMNTKSPCATDYRRLCSTVQIGKAAACLKKHLSELSPACKAKYGK